MSAFRELGSVEDTAMDAANAKVSAVSRGYYNDRYIEYFVPQRIRQLPPMNLGYYVRTISMYKAILKFYQLYGSEIQVVMLGCGYDTLYWRFRDENIRIKRWYDLDMAYIVNKKSEIIKHEIFLPLEGYKLLECDLSKPEIFKNILYSNNFEDIPTIFVDECTLIYVDPDSVDSIINFGGNLKNSSFISYGMIKPDDNFGKLMVKNFQSFGAPLKGIFKYPTVESHKKRFLNGGYNFIDSMDLNLTMKKVLKKEEYIRIIKLEIQDDPDELSYVLVHYVLAIASHDEKFLTLFE